MALLAAVVIYLIYLSAEALAVEGDDLYTYRVEGDNGIICRFYSESTAITVPDSVDGLGVTAIAPLFGDEARISANGTAVFVYPQGRTVNEANWLKGYTSYVYNKEHAVTSHTANYGQSGRGRNLSYTVVGPVNYTKTIMLVFEQHGFEDSYARDGQVLVDTAQRLISHYQKAKVSEFNQSRFVIVSSANPDGLAEGYTNNGPGRCTIVGKVDMNRDWPTDMSQQDLAAAVGVSRQTINAIEKGITTRR